ncbi:MAG: DUF971 domain-containing protein [Steroidobacteraceae bacterium]
MNATAPTQIKLRRQSRLLEVAFADGNVFELPFEYLRVFSPSAEVRGHAPRDHEPLLVKGKQDVQITRVEPVGQYAVKLVFDDGHDSGLYTWGFLHELGRDRDRNMQRYQERLRGN